MCGRIVWVWDAATGELIKRLVDDPHEDPEVQRVLEKMRYNVPPASHLPFVVGAPAGSTAPTQGPDDDVGTQGPPRTRLAVARWGFPIPQRPNGVFNTRIETAADSPMWRKLWGGWHGLLPVRGFYEWQRDGKTKTPFFIHRADGQPMLLAALMGMRTVGSESKLCASIVTSAPNRWMSQVHDRMPVIVQEAGAREWLDLPASGRKPEALVETLLPLGEDVLARHEVGPKVNSTAHDEPGLLEPTKQQRLF